MSSSDSDDDKDDGSSSSSSGTMDFEAEAVAWVKANCEYVPNTFLPSRVIMSLRDHSHHLMPYVRRAMNAVFSEKAVYKQLGPLRGFENIQVHFFFL